MRKIIKISLLFVLLTSTSVMAAENQQMKHQAMHAGQQWNDGVVKKIDLKDGKITLKHSAIAGVMPAMTMSYQVAPSESLKGMQTGDKVRFILKKNKDVYVVTHIEVVK